MLVANAITKRFGRIVALAGVDFCAREGEIHALVGENGAGKSTLINVFAGRLRPDDGHITLGGVRLSTGSAAAGLATGIAAVYQSPLLFERMTWEENLALGGFSRDRLSLGQVVTEARGLAKELGFSLPPAGTVVERRSVAERVRLEILRALSFQPRVLILDEPTSILSPAELQPFLQLLRRLRNQGRIVILVTHKLAEALAVADRITVLRHGRLAAERQAFLTDEVELAQLMMGRDGVVTATTTARRDLFERQPVVELQNVTLTSAERLVLDEVSIALTAGSIIGIAGVDGNGQDELVQLMAGVREPTSGSIVMRDPGSDERNPLAVIPQNRDVDGLILELSLWENLLLSRWLRKRSCSRHGWIRRSQAVRLCEQLIRRFSIRTSGPHAMAGSLSGGNRQRLAVARALETAPAAIVAHDICRGLDVNAAAELRTRLRDYAAQGGAVLLISSDLDELLALCERLYVINRGRIAQVEPGHRDPVEIGLLMSSSSQKSENVIGAGEPKPGEPRP